MEEMLKVDEKLQKDGDEEYEEIKRRRAQDTLKQQQHRSIPWYDACTAKGKFNDIDQKNLFTHNKAFFDQVDKTPEDWKRYYRKNAMLWHSDKPGGDGNKMQTLNAANDAVKSCLEWYNKI